MRDIVILAVIFASIPFAFLKPWFGILVWNWLGLMNPHRLGWTTQEIPVAQGVALAVLSGFLITKDKRPPPVNFEMVFLFIFFFHLTVTTAFSWYPQIAWEYWQRVLKIFLFVFLTPMVIYGARRLRLYFLTIVASLGFYGVKGGIFSIATGGNARIWGPEGTFIGGNNEIGLALCMTLPLMFYAAKDEKQKWVKLLLLGAFGLSVLAIIFTYSRGALLGLLATFAALFWRHWRLGLAGGFLVALAMPLIVQYVPEAWVERQKTTVEYQEDRSAMQRIQAWGVAINIAKEDPLTGAGFNFEFAGDVNRWISYANFIGPWENAAYSAHSIYFQVLGEHGFLGLALFGVLLFGTFFRLGRIARSSEKLGCQWIAHYARAAQAALVPFMVAGAFLDLAFSDLFYLMLVLAAMLHREYQSLVVSEGMHQTVGQKASQ